MALTLVLIVLSFCFVGGAGLLKSLSLLIMGIVAGIVGFTFLWSSGHGRVTFPSNIRDVTYQLHGKVQTPEGTVVVLEYDKQVYAVWAKTEISDSKLPPDAKFVRPEKIGDEVRLKAVTPETQKNPSTTTKP